MSDVGVECLVGLTGWGRLAVRERVHKALVERLEREGCVGITVRQARPRLMAAVTEPPEGWPEGEAWEGTEERWVMEVVATGERG